MTKERMVAVRANGVRLKGDLAVPAKACGLVVFAHGSGSGRMSPRNRAVARFLNGQRIATLLFDLLTDEEEGVDRYTGELRFNIPFLSRRLIQATRWARRSPEAKGFPLGYFGASTGAAAALVAAAEEPREIRAVVSRGGRPDLAGDALPFVEAPVLLIVGGNDQEVLGMNRDAMRRMRAEKRLEIVPGATHLFEEPGALERVAKLAAAWFNDHLCRRNS